MRVVQFEIPKRGRRVGVVDGESVRDITASYPDVRRVVDAFQAAEQEGVLLADWLEAASGKSSSALSYDELWTARPRGTTPFLRAPVDTEQPSQLLITGTGLTHLGSMQSRDNMHSLEEDSEDEADLTDSKLMYMMGVKGGRPPEGRRGAMPEWFYKGNGDNLRGPGEQLLVPEFAADGGEEAEVVGCYIIDSQGAPRRLGFTLGNEWSDHETERVNYLYLAPSKLRTCAVGPELVIGHEFDEIELRCRVYRDNEIIHDSDVLWSGEKHMCHSLANCEDHHFKYPQHRRPGDVHLHFFGTSNLSFGNRDWAYQSNDRIVIDAPGFSRSLVNYVRAEAKSDSPVRVTPA